ncbi:MAG: peptidase M48 [Xanthomonadales bacterium]|nr:peptidase M48 [Xanthomonadales bacterium]
MNFFEHQDRARKQTKVLVFAFMLAVSAIVIAMNLVMLGVFGRFQSAEQGWFSPGFWLANGQVVLWTSLATVLVIVLASAYRSAQLRGGGAQVARELGGVEVTGDSNDPLRRRLLNVVEEMAIASGVPVPQVFVLEHEPGINAFAAGWSPADAAVAVTRGTLETLNREELQGVIAHEFSHVFNGDMRLNIRLIGILFGILILAVAGRRMLGSMRFTRGRNKNAGAIVVVALAVMLVGYIGLFFGRWIQAAVSRQREYLADASAVQFTRSSQGLAGALKKIGARSSGSRLRTNTDEVGHMLFAMGFAGKLFATHPPLEKRILKIDPSFTPDQFAEIARDIERHEQARRAEREQRDADAAAQAAGDQPGGIFLDSTELVHQIGQPGVFQALLAAGLIAEVPAPLKRAAHSDEWAPELLLFLLLGRDPELRENQLLMIAETLGGDSESQVRDLVGIAPELPRSLRLPLLEMAFPVMRRRPERELLEFMRLVERLIDADGKTELFEYVLARLLNREIETVLNPSRGTLAGRKTLGDRAEAVSDLIAIVAMHGHPEDLDSAKRACVQALEGASGFPAPDPARFAERWPERLDEILASLQALRPDARGELIGMLVRCARHDGEVVVAEYELLRLVAGALGVPLPPAGAAGERE